MTRNVSKGRKAFTLVELSVGIGVFLLVLAGFAAIYFGQARRAERVGQKADLADQARRAYFSMTEEIKFGIDLLHPVEGSKPTPYLLFTNDKYELIGYWVEKYKIATRPDKEFRRLMRLNFNSPDGRKSETVAPFVDRIQFNRKANRRVDVEFAFRDADDNSMVLTSGVSCRNAVAVY